jgi:hypothetical protein
MFLTATIIATLLALYAGTIAVRQAVSYRQQRLPWHSWAPKRRRYFVAWTLMAALWLTAAGLELATYWQPTLAGWSSVLIAGAMVTMITVPCSLAWFNASRPRRLLRTGCFMVLACYCLQGGLQAIGS